MGGRSRAWRGAGSIAVASAIVLAACGIDRNEQLTSAADTCLGSTGPAALGTLFADEPGGVIAADYQRAIALPDGRTLWLFQDATIRLPPPPPTPTPTTTLPGDPPPTTERLLHNLAMVQSGTCFDVLRSGTTADPRPWLFANETTPFGHWFWLLDATMGVDGVLYVYVAEMVEQGPLYLSSTVPIGTRIVGIDPATMGVTFSGSPPDSSTALYGFSITSDATWTYLYSHCHRQFGWAPGPFGIAAHDDACSANVAVARLPKGRLFDAPAYWDGTTWQPDRNRAVAVIPTAGRGINPSQIRWTGTEFVAVTKVGDWFGSTIYLDRATRAEGPWTNYARLAATPKCPVECNTYFASWVPWYDGDDYIIGLSHNRWDGRLSIVNRPTFMTAPPPGAHAFALRCDLVDC